MESIRPSVFVNDNSLGIDRVKKGNYAFLMESTSIEYEVQRHCDLQQIGGQLDQKGYGIATPPDSPYRGFLSEAILHLQVCLAIHTNVHIACPDTPLRLSSLRTHVANTRSLTSAPLTRFLMHASHI